METLESRDLPSITIQLDYSRDTSGFFNNQAARDVMAVVADQLGDSLNTNLAAIVPSGTNTWTAFFSDPSTGTTVQQSNLTINADTIKVYVGARDLAGNTIGEGGFGGFSGSGSQTWVDTLTTRDHFGFSPWGGSIAFDSPTNWHYGLTTTGLDPSEVDFYSVALHEMGHVLGIGTSDQWFGHVDYFNGLYHGFNAANVHGGSVLLGGVRDHWSQSVTVNGQSPSLVPGLPLGTRVNFSALDYAALRDLGWEAIDPNGLSVRVITVGSETFTLDSAGNLYGLASGGPSVPVLLAANVQQIGTAEGQFFALDVGGGLSKYSFLTGSMVLKATGITQIGPGQGRFFALRNDGALLRYNSATVNFDITVANNIVQIGPGQGQLFALYTNGALLRYNDSTGSLDTVIAEGVIRLATTQPEIFILRHDDVLLRYNGTTGTFDTSLSGVTDVAVSAYRLLVLGNDGAVLRYNPYSTGYDTLIPGGITQIAAAQGRFFVLDTNGVVSRYNVASDGFDVSTTNVTQIASGQGRIFALDVAGNVYRYGAAADSFNTVVATSVTQIASNQGRFFILTNTGVVSRFEADTGTFTTLLTNVFKIGTGQGKIFALDNLGNVYRYGAAAGVFNLAGTGAINIASARGEFFLLDGTGVVYRYNGSTAVGSYDVSYPGNIATIWTIDGDFYILRNDNVFLKYDPDTGGYVQV